MIRALIVASLALCASAARAEPPAAVEGAWTFTTSEYHVAKSGALRTYTIVQGDLRVSPSQDERAYACDMRTTQNWYEQNGNAKPIVTETMSSVQSCTLTRDGDKVTIIGTIVSVTDEGYRADDFSLKLESASRMTGDMHSRWQDNRPVAKAVFQRGPGMIS